jgi:hypothetical protein
MSAYDGGKARHYRSMKTLRGLFASPREGRLRGLPTRRKLRAEGLLRAVKEWEVENGPLADHELRAAARTIRRRRRK